MRRRRVPVPGGTVVVFVLTILTLLRMERARVSFGWGLGASFPLWARRAGEEEVTVAETDAGRNKAEDRGRLIGFVTGAEHVSRALERAGSGEGAVGPATVVGDRTVIPLVETYATGGFGGGSGVGVDGASEGSGGGGGGGGLGRSRTIAVADVGPEGVKIRPVVDVTGLALPAVTALAALLLGRGRRRRR
ncbi:MAG TPA: hypothetical protein VKI01_00755 [Acidimicrobiia bacterium]|nr:hypothetical protein [Acidimicrobiia bacterium]